MNADFILFSIFSALTIIAGLLMVTSRHAVYGAMYMVLSFVGTAGLFVLLNAFFLGLLQVLVYAGAIMVLFLFIIMLLDVDKVARTRPPFWSSVGAVALAGLMSVGAIYTMASGAAVKPSAVTAALTRPDGTVASAPGADLVQYGELLFTKYQLPFVVIGFLLLVAMLGVIVLSKRLPNETEPTKQPPAA